MFPVADAQLFLKAMMLGASDEVYLLDASSMKLVYVSENAQKNLGQDLASFKPKNIDGLLGVSKEALQEHVKHSKSQANIIEVTLEQDPTVIKTDDYQLRVMLLQANKKEYILVIKNDLTSNERTLQALNESEIALSGDCVQHAWHGVSISARRCWRNRIYLFKRWQ